MAQYSIGEVEQLTGIRPYVLRYWEEVIPCFSPKKDINGRRIYSARDIDTINRLKYLIYTKRYTIDGARTQIIQESAVAEAQIQAVQALHEIRSELGDLYLGIQKSKEKRTSLTETATLAEKNALSINTEFSENADYNTDSTATEILEDVTSETAQSDSSEDTLNEASQKQNENLPEEISVEVPEAPLYL